MFAYCSRVRDEFKSEKGWRRGQRVKNEKGWRRSQGTRTKANNSAIERERASFPVLMLRRRSLCITKRQTVGLLDLIA
jgi:hypothetical protein